ncbi:hypothetical protein [Streptomyces canus]|uniref:hypothetical protein n=1 Tax=Streptomyces canus TaxID=58343 RepID=UPI002E30EF61|nr:hypothetical protein [Streptomyces canus]
MIQSVLDEEPDDLYITTDSNAGADHAVWPGGSTFSAAAGTQIPLGIQLRVDGSQEVFLWDQDDVSADDLLGSVTISEDEQGGGSLSKLAHSEEERSYYYVRYHVDSTPTPLGGHHVVARGSQPGDPSASDRRALSGTQQILRRWHR